MASCNKAETAVSFSILGTEGGLFEIQLEDIMLLFTRLIMHTCPRAVSHAFWYFNVSQDMGPLGTLGICSPTMDYMSVILKKHSVCITTAI